MPESHSLDTHRFNDEIGLLDSFYEFHPEAFNALPDHERELLERYYFLGQVVPDDVFACRAEVIRDDPELAPKAREVLQRVLASLGTRI